MNENTRIFVNCECATEGLILDHETDKNYKVIYIALWSYGSNGQYLPWRERVRWCWNILRKGLPWTDEIVLHVGEAKKFSQALTEKIKVLEEK